MAMNENMLQEYEIAPPAEAQVGEPVVLDPDSDENPQETLKQYEERTFLGAIGEGMMGESEGIVPEGFIKSVGSMIASIPQFLGAGAKQMVSPGGEGNTLTETMLGKVTTAVLKEMLTADGEGEFEETHPVTAEVVRILGDEVLYFRDKQKLYEKIATAPAEVLSDIASAVGAAFTGGATVTGANAPRLAKALQIGARATEIMDPAMIPSHAVGAVGRMRKPASAEGFDPDAAEAAERFGAGKEMTPDTVLNPNMETREYLMGGLEGKPGIETRERLDATLDAIDATKRRITDELAKGVDPYNAEVAGKSVLDAYQLRQFEDKVEFKKVFQQIRAQFADEIPTDHEWRKHLDAALAELKPTQVDPQELQKVRGIVDDILQDVDTRKLTLNDIDAFRTEFRQRMITQFNKRDVNVIGSGSMTEKIYNAITNDLYDSIEATVKASNGALPASLLDDVRKAKAAYRDIKMLEDTAGGKFLVRNQDKPAELINGLLRGSLSTDEVKNVYKLIGDEATADIQATLMNKIFQTATKGPLGLKNRIAKINGDNPERIAELFGGGDKGKEVATELSAFAEFIASTERVRLRDRGTITGRANQMLAGGVAMGTITGAMDVARALAWSGDVSHVATVGAGLAVSSLLSTGYLKWATSDIGRRRIREGLGGEQADLFFKAVDDLRQRGVIKPAELGERVRDEAEERDSLDVGAYR